MHEKYKIKSITGWLKSRSDNRNIFVGMVWVAGFVLIAKLAAAAKEMAVAWRYGISDIVDAYLFVLNLVSWPVAVWTSVLTVVLIPLAARIREQSPQSLPRFRAELLGLAILMGVFLVALSQFGLPMLLKSNWVGLPAHTATIAAGMAPLLSWLTIIGVLVGLYSTWTMSDGRHANTLFEGIPAIGILTGVLLFSGIEPLLWGAIGGALAQLVCLVVPFSTKRELESPVWTFSSSYWIPFRRGFGVMLTGQLLMSLTGIIDQFFAAHLATGAISTLGYANRILSLVVSLGATAVTRATLPVFSNARARSPGPEQALDPALHWAKILFIIGVLGAVAGWCLAPLMVRTLFERGQFTAADADSTSAVLRFGMAQLPFYFCSLVFASAHSSRGHYKALLLSGMLGLSVKLLVNALLMKNLSINALMLSSAAMYFSNMILLFGLWRFTKGSPNKTNLETSRPG